VAESPPFGWLERLGGLNPRGSDFAEAFGSSLDPNRSASASRRAAASRSMSSSIPAAMAVGSGEEQLLVQFEDCFIGRQQQALRRRPVAG
jgi:hypothetical protein